MDKEKIEKRLLDNRHGWDKNTINVLSNYFYELFLTIDNFIDVNELLKRFIEGDNLKNGIIYVEESLIDDKYEIDIDL